MAGRPRTRSDDDVTAATMRVLGRRGPARMTLGDVAAEVGLAPSTLAERFGSKRELLLAASRASASGVQDAFRCANAQHGAQPLAALVEALDRLARPASTRKQFANHLAALELDVADPAFRREAKRHAGELRAAIARQLYAASESGDLSAGADPEQLARAVHVAYNGALVTWAIGGTGRLSDALEEDIEAVLAPNRSGRD